MQKRKKELLSAGIHKINISLHSFEGVSDEKHISYICELAEFAKSAAEHGIIVVFRLWNNGFDDGKNEVVFNISSRIFPVNGSKTPVV